MRELKFHISTNNIYINKVNSQYNIITLVKVRKQSDVNYKSYQESPRTFCSPLVQPLSHYCVSTHVSTAYQDTYVSIRNSYSSIRSSYSSYANVLCFYVYIKIRSTYFYFYFDIMLIIGIPFHTPSFAK